MTANLGHEPPIANAAAADNTLYTAQPQHYPISFLRQPADALCIDGIMTYESVIIRQT